jgi:hypothetical protein
MLFIIELEQIFAERSQMKSSSFAYILALLSVSAITGSFIIENKQVSILLTCISLISILLAFKTIQNK